MIRDDSVHLIANLSVTVILGALSLVTLWTVMDMALYLRLALSVATLFLCALVGHRLVPRLTGPLLDRLLALRRTSSQWVLAAVKGDRPGLRWLETISDGSAVAFLATVERRPLVIPLLEGRNFVGRQRSLTHHRGWKMPYPVEAAQWFVVCESGKAWIQDAASTNGSFLRSTRPDGQSATVPIELHHEMAPPRRLQEGDELLTCYAVLVFGWT